MTAAYSLRGAIRTVSLFCMYPVSIRPAAQNPPAPPEVGLNISEIDILNGFSINRGGLRKLSIAYLGVFVI